MLTPVQICVSPPTFGSGDSDYIYALCRGGSIWFASKDRDGEWEWRPLPKIKPGAPNNAEAWEPTPTPEGEQ